VGDQLVHQRQRQRGVGAGQQRDVLMAFFGGFASARVYADEFGAVALGLLRVAPEMQVAADGVAAPDDDEFGLGEKLHPHADLAAQGLREGLAAGRRADGAVEEGRAQPVEEAPGHAFALHLAHGAGIAVGNDGLGVARGDGLEARRDVGQRGLPAHRLELPAALGAAALERLQQALGVVGALGVARDLVAQHAAGVGMVGIALHAGGDAAFHRGQQRAGVGAVVRAGAQHLPGGRLQPGYQG
jgi:hypothetical protein